MGVDIEVWLHETLTQKLAAIMIMALRSFSKAIYPGADLGGRTRRMPPLKQSAACKPEVGHNVHDAMQFQLYTRSE